MNNNTENTRPFGYWLRSVGTLLDREFAVAFENEDASRGDWMLLNAVSGDKPGRADRLARKGKRLRTLEDRGWIVRVDDGWELTDDGRAAKERLGVIVEGIRARVSGAVSPDDFATTMDSLEAIARELGWEEGMRMPRRGFGRRFGHGFGHGHGHGFGHREFGHHAFDRHGCQDHARGGHRRAERAYERGFDAGFTRGRDA